MEILLASQNNHKKMEINSIIKDHTILLPDEKGINFYYEEIGSTYLENTLGKAKHLYKIIQKPVLADDSGLSIPALNGAPGINSARYGSINGKNLSDMERNIYLLEKLKNIKNRDAFFVCCMVLILEEYRFFIIQETIKGKITENPSGKNGFGYDPLFFVPEYRKTMAELEPEIKNKISHRGKAVEKIKKYLQ